ncbi:hypothetical protein NX059_006882 [Plenodomus lindquistii]|nr:hypothetical protein NX059_006882 [Plenodomus lindquistii]
MPDGTKVSVAQGIPEAKIYTQELRFVPDELTEYNSRKSACSKNFMQELTPEQAAQITEENIKVKLGSKLWFRMCDMS